MDKYQGFSDWADVSAQFSGEYGPRAKLTIPEPAEVIVAFYGSEGYEGYAYVVYRQGRKFYVVTGSHWSCHGLEDQWEPTEYTKTEFKAYLSRLVEEHAQYVVRFGGDESDYYFERRNAAKLLELVA